MVTDAEKAYGSVDVLVNNAGIQHVAPIEEFPIDTWNLIIAINLSAAFHAIAAAIPGMKARKWGRIISTASAHSKVASPFKSAYVTAKHGIAGLTKTAALELARFGVTVNCISPGYVWTPLVEKQIPDTMAARHMTREQVINDVLLTAQPTKEFVTVDEVAALAVFLPRTPPSRSPAPISRSTAAGRLNKDVNEVASPIDWTGQKQISLALQGGGCAWRLHLGRARRDPRG